MSKTLRFVLILLAAALSGAFGNPQADEVRVAVASNFVNAVEDLAREFEHKSGHDVLLSMGSTGKHYAQIKHGAPFDVFLAADADRPMLLEQEGEGLPGTRLTYARGKLVLWTPKPGRSGSLEAVLGRADFHHLAIANPKLAPYGKAAREVLLALNLWDSLSGRMVRGENIGQTFQFVKSGNAELGFVAFSQLKTKDGLAEGTIWNVPRTLYSPIEQQAILLKDTTAAREFLQFLASERGRSIIEQNGYDAP